jgi:DNA-binding NtrC family response regulator
MIKVIFEDQEGGVRPRPATVSGDGQSQGTSRGASVLLVDDNTVVARAMEIAFQVAGHRLEFAPGPQEALSRLASARYDAVLLDMNFGPGETSGEEGLACLRRIMADDPTACVVVITAHSGVGIAVAAMQAGARDFVMKPWRNRDLIAKVEAAIARRAPIETPSAPPVAGEAAPARLLGDSAAVQRLRDLIRRIGPTSASVAVVGPSGAGRTLAARAIHAASPLADQPLRKIDLRDPAAWRFDPEEGAVILRHAEALDDVAQSRLLDQLPPTLRCFSLLSGTAGLSAALRRRLATVEAATPSLAEREDDAVILARHFAREASERFGRPAAQLTPGAEAAIRAAAWPDEARGLALAVERAVLLSEDGKIEAAAVVAPLSPVLDALDTPADNAFDLGDAEKAIIAAALREHRHNVSQAAAALGLSRGALYRRMARHGL